VTSDIERNEDGLVTVVCGAPNVREGLSVAWLPPGATVPDSYDKDPFVLTARDLRGVVSNGMLASPKELAINDNHDGILEIDGEHKPGASFAETYGLKNEFIIDIENKMFTHRPDCFGWIGVSREVAGITHNKFVSPDWYLPDPKTPEPEAEMLPVKVINELPELVPRFCALPMSGIAVKPSPVWLQIELVKVGLRPINNIVDLTNFWMLMTGQPLHAYDYDKVKALSGGDETVIKVRNPEKGERLKLLNGKVIEPRAEAIMIATDKQSIGLAGVMGGENTEVDDSTTNIILESANFNMYSIRRSSMEHGLFSDAATRFTKGQSPLQNKTVILKVADDIKNIASGKIAGPLIDDKHLNTEITPGRASLYEPVTTTPDFINTRLGLSLCSDEIKELLTNVEFEVDVNGDKLTFTAPFWRTDIEIPEDIVEEVGRLYGYDHLPLVLPSRDLIPASKDPMLSAKAAIRQRLSSLGANEVLTYSFVHGDLLTKAGQNKDNAYQIGNALRPELQYYRLSLMPSLLDKVHPNIKAGQDNFMLFEIGKVHDQAWANDEGLPDEYEYTALVVATADKFKITSNAYYTAKQYLSLLVPKELVFRPLSEDAMKFPVAAPYEPKKTAMVYIKETDEFLGIVGEFTSKVRRDLKLPKFSAGFEVDTKILANLITTARPYHPLSRFPKVSQDVSLKVNAELNYQDLYEDFWTALQNNQPPKTLISLGAHDIYQGEDKSTKNITFRVSVVSDERTLTDKEVANLLDVAVDQVSSSSERL
jgi:phenylalanyl-tRNA synthetase beta chain